MSTIQPPPDPTAYFANVERTLPARYKSRVNSPSAYRVTILPTVSRERALRGKMNGDIRELAGATMPRTAKQRANAPRSKVTGITAGSNIHGAAYEDAVANSHRSTPRSN